MDMKLLAAYAPRLYFDKKEPFYPARVGVSVIRQDGHSPSFRRSFEHLEAGIDYVIEFAIYWDYDIQHLYELEHVWIYVDKAGEVADAEASFHGKYLKALLPYGSNLAGKTVNLYSQPGKHAFSPVPILFELLPNARIVTDQEAGRDGLTLPEWYRAKATYDDQTNELVRAYQQRYHRFTPAFEFVPYELAKQESLFVPWEVLYEEIPKRIEAELAIIRHTLAGLKEPWEG
ncbi:hypothetical protein M3194_05625 [Paenibacillus glycanilyticus]|uniref:hypothetical protein n=1 Tax=Paenibacillus glycanilyticus TaxID=126569 RepID=UPI00203B37A1|nr:hypothetical protein [Paenibacillus glycanilyticus]MCM3626839.1 hypothetical protein [Paenibacillus glycanilyticus]